jgi:hypothetical protein
VSSQRRTSKRMVPSQTGRAFSMFCVTVSRFFTNNTSPGISALTE